VFAAIAGRGFRQGNVGQGNKTERVRGSHSFAHHSPAVSIWRDKACSLAHFGIKGEKPTPHGADNLLQTKPLYLLTKTTVNIKIVKYVFLTTGQENTSLSKYACHVLRGFLDSTMKNRPFATDFTDAKKEAAQDLVERKWPERAGRGGQNVDLLGTNPFSASSFEENREKCL
jgi:hypothetical protein